MNSTLVSLNNIKLEINQSFQLASSFSSEDGLSFQFMSNGVGFNQGTIRHLTENNKLFATIRGVNRSFFESFGGLSPELTVTKNKEIVEQAIKENICKLFFINPKQLSFHLFNDDGTLVAPNEIFVSIINSDIDFNHTKLILTLMRSAGFKSANQPVLAR